MYIFDFFKRLTSKKNIPIVIYLVLNVFIVAVGMRIIIGLLNGTGGIVNVMTLESNNSRIVLDLSLALLIGIVVYSLFLVVALSPIGEWIIRKQNHCNKIERKEQIDVIEPIFREVYDKSRALDPSISGNVQLSIREGKEANSFAIGRNSICITEGFLSLPVDQMKASLGHELGHLANKDTDLLLVVAVGNILVNIIIWLVQAAIFIFGRLSNLISSIFSKIVGAVDGGATVSAVLETLLSCVLNVICMIMSFIFIRVFFTGWTRLGCWLVKKACRDTDYEADEFAFNAGYGIGLCQLLDSADTEQAPEGLFAALSRNHPPKDSRIAKLQALGCTYKASYGIQ